MTITLPADLPPPWSPFAQIDFQPDSSYVSSIFGSNSICLVQTGCTSATAQPLVPSSSLLFEACTPSSITPGDHRRRAGAVANACL